MSQKLDKWTTANARRHADVNQFGPSYPSEFMVKIFASPYYSRLFKPLSPNDLVLDIGCGFANNLLFFLERGCRGYGVDVTEDMISLARENLNRLGQEANIGLGTNDNLPFGDAKFDIVLSMNTIHYQEGTEGIKRALLEFSRVLKVGGRLFLVTVGPEHEMRTQSEKLNPCVYKVITDDFRSGDLFGFFDDQDHLEETIARYFDQVESGRTLERYAVRTVDFLYALAVKGSR